MTTIAFDGKTFASDTLITGNFIQQTGFDKIRVFDKDGDTLIASGCGELQLLCALFSHLNGETDEFPTSPDNEFEAMVYSVNTGELTLYQNRMIPMKIEAPHSIGSGSLFAMGAMVAGASAEKAVEVAMKLDSATGGQVKSVSIDEVHQYARQKAQESKLIRPSAKPPMSKPVKQKPKSTKRA